MSRVFHTATFSPDDSPARIREELACPACGHQDPGEAHPQMSDNTLRIFCSGCGAFVTIAMTEEQAEAIRRGLEMVPAVQGELYRLHGG